MGDLLTDVYMLAFVGLLYGGGAAESIRRHLALPATGAAQGMALRGWLVLALLATAGALVWRALRAVGPLVTTPAAQSWVLATPIDRAGWLRLPYVALLVLSGLLGAGVGVLAAWAGNVLAIGWSGLAGAGAGVALAAGAVAVQPHPRHATRRASAAALALGLGIALFVVVAGRLGVRMAAPAAPAVVVAPASIVAAAYAVRQARRALPRLNRAALGGGAQLTGAAVTAVIMLDPSMLSGILTARRWRQAATVHSRHLRAGPRWWVLLQADLLRQVRRRADVLTYAALALVPYAVAVFAPLATGGARIVAAYLAVERLAGGLRTVARTPALRRLLGGSDRELRLVHLVIPALGLAPWWLATGWAGATAPPGLTAVLVAGVIAAVYRTATRPPMSYEAGLADSPFGPIPTTLLRRLVRGPDLVAVLVLIDLFVSIGRR
jgi:hypothetical protein